MDPIITYPNQRVIFARQNVGYEHEQLDAAKHLVLGQAYTVKKRKVNAYSTSVELAEVPGVIFNDAFFEDVRRATAPNQRIAKDDYTIHENIAAISASFHADSRLAGYIHAEQESYCERLRMLIDAAQALTEREPEDYAASGLDWDSVTDAIADGLHEGLGVSQAVDRALAREAVEHAGAD